MKEKMEKVEKETKFTKPMKNKEVIETFTGLVQKEKVTVLPPTQINNKGGRTKKRMKGKKEIAKEKQAQKEIAMEIQTQKEIPTETHTQNEITKEKQTQKDGRTCRKCGRFIKYGSKEKHDKRNCHKFPIEE